MHVRTVLGSALIGAALAGCQGGDATRSESTPSVRTTAKHTRVLWVTGMT